MARLLIVIEKSGNGYGAFAPDIPGVGVVGDTREETERLMREALEMHLETMREEGASVPEPQSYATYIEVAP